MTSEQLSRLLESLILLPTETEWVEFKVNNFSPEPMAELISALANSACLCGKDAAYLVWGVQNDNHEVVGTEFRPRQEKNGNEELENWLNRTLRPHVDLRIHEFQHQCKQVVIFQVGPASSSPVRFKDHAFIRIGSCKHRLQDYPEKEKVLWRSLEKTPFESRIALSDLNADEVLARIDYPAYFELSAQSLPSEKAILLHLLKTGQTNLGSRQRPMGDHKLRRYPVCEALGRF